MIEEGARGFPTPLKLVPKQEFLTRTVKFSELPRLTTPEAGAPEEEETAGFTIKGVSFGAADEQIGAIANPKKAKDVNLPTITSTPLIF